MHAKSLSTVTAALLVLATTGCADEPEPADDLDTPPAAETPGATADTAAIAGTSVRVEDIVGDPAAYDGREVTVEADVEEVHSPRAFALDEDSPVAGGIDNDLVVLYPMSASLADIDDQWLNNRVRVTGTVRTVSIVDIEREIGWDLDPEIEADLEGMKPVLIARTVERVGSGR